MSDHADTEKYEELMEALRGFIDSVSEACEGMGTAGSTCVDCMGGDPSAVKANEKLQGCIRYIKDAVSRAEGIIKDLQSELEEIIIAGEEDF